MLRPLKRSGRPPCSPHVTWRHQNDREYVAGADKNRDLEGGRSLCIGKRTQRLGSRGSQYVGRGVARRARRPECGARKEGGKEPGAARPPMTTSACSPME